VSARVLACSGLEPSGFAGLLVDLQTLRAEGVVPLGIASALTAQGRTTFRIEPAPSAVVLAQLRALIELGTIDAVKLGMIPDARRLNAWWKALAPVRGWRVVDPVVRSSSGGRLSALTPRDYLALAGPRVLLTPNADEARWLLGDRRVSPEMAAERLVQWGFGAVVVKGGHRSGPAVDVVQVGRSQTSLGGVRVPRSPSVHRGTGCRYASALAARLGLGDEVVKAARIAKTRVTRFLRDAGKRLA
jgi:hydroxymethylpyrimidine/phosphomethylpyrimidine kinase